MAEFLTFCDSLRMTVKGSLSQCLSAWAARGPYRTSTVRFCFEAGTVPRMYTNTHYYRAVTETSVTTLHHYQLTPDAYTTVQNTVS